MQPRTNELTVFLFFFRFYYADERTAEGAPVYNKIDGPAHGEFYVQLAKDDGKIPWLATFAKGHGYKDFQELSKS